MSTRRLRVYEVYRAGSRLSCRTATPYSTDAEILHVGAYSVRQAYHLAGRGNMGPPARDTRVHQPVVLRGRTTTGPRPRDRYSGTGNRCRGCIGRR